ncbi:MAG: HEAT repeat domain-containing protein [Gemmataceae bacterium]
MLRRIAGNKTVLGLTSVVLLGCAALLWFQWGTAQSWYYLRGLSKATDSDRAVWVNRVVGLETAAVPGLIKGLEADDRQSCANFSEALEALTEKWAVDDRRTMALVQRIAENFSHFSSAGQQTSLVLVGKWQRGLPGDSENAERFYSVAEKILAGVVPTSDPDVRAAALSLIESLIAFRPGRQDAIRDVLKATLHDTALSNRLRAMELACQPGMELFKEIVTLLNDPAAEARRQAMEAVRRQPKAAEVLGDDDLLRWLNDPDEEVRRLCEGCLAERGLTVEAIQLGRLITNSKPTVRLEVLQYLNSSSDLDANTWIRHLSHDESPAVRSAAMRAAIQLDLRSLSDRLDQMARADPSPTVRQLAHHYLGIQKRESPVKAAQ